MKTTSEGKGIKTRCAFLPAEATERPVAAVLRWLAEIALLGMLSFLVRSPGEISLRYCVLLGIVAVVLFIVGWLVLKDCLSWMGARLWVLFGSGVCLSLSVKGQSLERPPATGAVICVIALGIAAILSALVDRRYVKTGYEVAVVVTMGTLAIIMATMFRSVVAQNLMDPAMWRHVFDQLWGYLFLFAGVSVLTQRRASFFRTAMFVGLACLLRIAMYHSVPGA